jgi:iron complex transport system ATP-binding protein
LTAFEAVLLGRLRSLAFRPSDTDLDAARATMDAIGIADLAARRLGELSGGQRQLAFLAQALADAPDTLLLDEPTSALDIAHQPRVLAAVKRAARDCGLAVCAVLHDLNAAARWADRVAVLSDGRVAVCAPPAEALRPDTIRAAFGVDAAVVPGPDGRPMIAVLGA